MGILYISSERIKYVLLSKQSKDGAGSSTPHITLFYFME